jgi:hypothetical protein
VLGWLFLGDLSPTDCPYLLIFYRDDYRRGLRVHTPRRLTESGQRF